MGNNTLTGPERLVLIYCHPCLFRFSTLNVLSFIIAVLVCTSIPADTTVQYCRTWAWHCLILRVPLARLLRARAYRSADSDWSRARWASIRSAPWRSTRRPSRAWQAAAGTSQVDALVFSRGFSLRSASAGAQLAGRPGPEREAISGERQPQAPQRPHSLQYNNATGWMPKCSEFTLLVLSLNWTFSSTMAFILVHYKSI